MKKIEKSFEVLHINYKGRAKVNRQWLADFFIRHGRIYRYRNISIL